MTKTQVRSQLRKLFERLQTLIDDDLSNIIDELNDLQSEVEDTRDNIEPYEGCDELSVEQEERIDWMDSAASCIEEAVGSIESALDYLTESQTSLEEVE